MEETIAHNVPYVNQNFNVQHWQSDNFKSLDESRYWSNNSCGIACVLMVLRWNNVATKTNLANLLQVGVEAGGFCERGWIHSKLIEVINYFGVNAERINDIKSDTDIWNCLKKNEVLIVSVSYQFPINKSKGGHLVVVTGMKKTKNKENMILINDPSNWGLQNKEIESSRFFSSFSGCGIRVKNGN